MQVEWRKLRSDELRVRAAQDAIVILPVGSIEQHGPHLPVEVDALLGEQVALRTAARIAESQPVVVLPMQWAGLAEHHMSSGGTITLDTRTFLDVIRCICESVVRHGFRRIVLLNGHGGNDTMLKACADDLTPRLRVPIVSTTYWYGAAEAIAPILEMQASLLHADEAETSMMLALRPELIDPARIALGRTNTGPDVNDIVGGGGLHRWRTMRSFTSTGVWGHPEAASAEKGERLLAAIADTLAAKLANAEMWAMPFLDGQTDA